MTDKSSENNKMLDLLSKSFEQTKEMIVRLELPEPSMADEIIIGEPLIHSHITDCLPDDHVLARENVWCAKCDAFLHMDNECMTTWVETGRGNFCIKCFYFGNKRGKEHGMNDCEVLDDDYGLVKGKGRCVSG